MTVKELKEELNNLPDDLEVKLWKPVESAEYFELSLKDVEGITSLRKIVCIE